MYNLIACVNKHGLLGQENDLYATSSKDLHYFSQVTKGHSLPKPNIIVMGYNTWLSLPHKPLKDRYNINLATSSLTLIGIPIYVDKQDMNIIGKEAINLRFGLKMLKNNWVFSGSFSQHIPYKIDLREEIIPPEEELEKEDIYGGGLFNLSLTRYLN